SAAYRDRVPWQQTHFFWGDERHVPPDHEDSNYRMAHEAMLSKVSIPAAHIYRIAAEKEAQQAADEYAATLQTAFQLEAGALPRFDLILLGMGQPQAERQSATLLHTRRQLAVPLSRRLYDKCGPLEWR